MITLEKSQGISSYSRSYLLVSMNLTYTMVITSWAVEINLEIMNILTQYNRKSQGIKQSVFFIYWGP